MARVAVVGAGLAGLSAALAVHEAGADVVLVEAAAEPGGTTAMSAGWIWRYRDRQLAARGAPHAPSAVRDAVVERLDHDVAWLVGRGVRPLRTDTPRATTRGVQVDPGELVARLVERLPRDALHTGTRVVGARLAGTGIELEVMGAGDPIPADRVVFAGGGYAADLARVAREADAHGDAAAHWRRRGSGSSDGSSLAAARALGAVRPRRDGESFVRLLPAGRALVGADLVGFGELAEHGTLGVDGTALPRADHDWSGAIQQWRFAVEHGIGTLRLDHPSAAQRRLLERLGIESRSRGRAAMEFDVVAGITHTICGVATDARGCVVAAEPAPGDGERAVFAAGCDALGSGAGGYASGLAQALVLGRAAGMLAAGATVA